MLAVTNKRYANIAATKSSPTSPINEKYPASKPVVSCPFKKTYEIVYIIHKPIRIDVVTFLFVLFVCIYNLFT